MNEFPHPGFNKPENYETFTTANQPEDIDRLTDIIYQQGIEKGKDEMRDALVEWAEKKIAKGMIDEWDNGYVQCLKDLIHKCNSFQPLIR